MNLNLYKEKILNVCPDCILFFHNYIIVSSYDFVTDNVQQGSIILYNFELDELDRWNGDGILDMKIAENYFVACSVESNIYYFTVNEHKLQLTGRVTLDQKIKLLYLHMDQDRICLGGDQGEVIILNKQDQHIQKLHEYSVWSTLIDNQTRDLYYSGSDDMKLILSDLRAGIVSVNSKSHTQGITHLLNYGDNTLITASFDQYMRFFDKRQLKVPYQENKRNSGIWRIVPQKTHFLNALFTESKYEITDLITTQEITGYGSLAYGCDWRDNSVVTLSFYDKVIKLHKIV